MQAFKGARTLSEFAGRKIYVECLKCEIRRRYDGNATIARVGGRVAMPELLNLTLAFLACNGTSISEFTGHISQFEKLTRP